MICELANDDGTVMVGDQIRAFGAKHGLKMISVADLIAYRQSREKLVERVATFPVKTIIGELTGYAYQSRFDEVQHFAFVLGRIGDGLRVPTRLPRGDIINDVLGGATLINKALERFKAEGRGVLIYLRDGAAGVPVVSAAPLKADDARTVQWREVGLGAQIMRDLGIRSIKLLASQDRTYVGLSGFGIEIVSRENVDG